eukprot:3214345-Rhodomonas_salina.2
MDMAVQTQTAHVLFQKRLATRHGSHGFCIHRRDPTGTTILVANRDSCNNRDSLRGFFSSTGSTTTTRCQCLLSTRGNPCAVYYY